MDHFSLAGAKDESDAEVLASFIKQFYESATYVPRRLLLPFDVAESELLTAWLTERRGKPVELLTPQRGEKRQLVEMAQTEREGVAGPGAGALDGRQRQDGGGAGGAAGRAGAAGPAAAHRVLRHLEHSGTSSVGSMVVFVDGQAAAAGVPSLPDQDGRGRGRLRDRWRRCCDVASRRRAAVPGGAATHVHSFTPGPSPLKGEGTMRRSLSAKGQSTKRSEGRRTPAAGEGGGVGTLPDLLIVDGGRGS